VLSASIEPSLIVITRDYLKSVSKGGGRITKQYLSRRCLAGLAGIQAHFTAEESGREGGANDGMTTSVPVKWHALGRRTSEG
jgi:hypothetical protein